MCLLSSGPSLPTLLLGQGTPVGISSPVGPVLTPAQGETGACARPAGLCWKALSLLSADRMPASSFHHNYRNIDFLKKFQSRSNPFSVFLEKEQPQLCQFSCHAHWRFAFTECVHLGCCPKGSQTSAITRGFFVYCGWVFTGRSYSFPSAPTGISLPFYIP